MNDMFGRSMDRDLDNFITGHYGEDQFRTRQKRKKHKKLQTKNSTPIAFSSTGERISHFSHTLSPSNRGGAGNG